MLMQSKGELIKLPSLPAAYDYELNPQEVWAFIASPRINIDCSTDTDDAAAGIRW